MKKRNGRDWGRTNKGTKRRREGDGVTKPRETRQWESGGNIMFDVI